jgi:hypothetical protein
MRLLSTYKRYVTQVAIKSHSSFIKYETSTESRDMFGSLWICPPFVKQCASLWPRFRLHVGRESKMSTPLEVLVDYSN